MYPHTGAPITGAGNPCSAQKAGNSSSQSERVGVPSQADQLGDPFRAGRGRVARQRLGEVILGQPQRVERVVDVALQGLVFEARGHVDERARRRGDADAELGRHVAPAERRRSVDADALGAPVAYHRDLERLVPLAPVAPERHRGAVAECRARSAREHGGGGALVWGDRRRPDGIHAAEDAVQPTDRTRLAIALSLKPSSCSCRRVMLPFCLAATARDREINPPLGKKRPNVGSFLPEGRGGSGSDGSHGGRHVHQEPATRHDSPPR